MELALYQQEFEGHSPCVFLLKEEESGLLFEEKL